MQQNQKQMYLLTCVYIYIDLILVPGVFACRVSQFHFCKYRRVVSSRRCSNCRKCSTCADLALVQSCIVCIVSKSAVFVFFPHDFHFLFNEGLIFEQKARPIAQEVRFDAIGIVMGTLHERPSVTTIIRQPKSRSFHPSDASLHHIHLVHVLKPMPFLATHLTASHKLLMYY